MTALLPEKFWDVIRPFHRPLTTALRQRLGRNYIEHPEMDLPPAWDATQLEVERRLHRYLHVSREEIRQIVIVGANNAEEIPRLRSTYPNSRFLCFEPSPAWHRGLVANFGECGWVTCSDLALSDQAGSATFYELPMPGNGSLLEPEPERWARFNQWTENEVTSFEVKVSTLDAEAADLEKIDLLWIDVQGAEGNVLKGAGETLKRVGAIFMEVALVESPYRGALLFPELNATLQSAGFTCCGLGVDGWNFAGNALWVRDVAGRACRQLPV